MSLNILVTGFAPFDGASVNPSWQAAQKLDRWPHAGRTVVAREIPCAFGTAIDALQALIEGLAPEVVILAGQAGGRPDLSVERVAVNLDDADKPDNDGAQPFEAAVFPGGPAAYFASIPVKPIVAAMRAAGLPASVSHTAGSFVCNHLFYGACHLRATRYPSLKVGFIHVPYSLEQGATHPGAPTMAIDAIAEALKIAVRTTLEA
jgi:pyroglutamyl-peptidase